MTTTTSSESFIELGIVGKPRGLSGAFVFRPHNPQSDAFDTVEEVQVAGVIRAIEWLRPAGSGIEMKLAGIDSPEAAKALTHQAVSARQSDLPPPEAGEIYLADLAGKTAVDEAGQTLGVVTGFSRSASEIYIDVRAPNGEVVSLPSSGPFVLRVGPEQVVLAGVDGLFSPAPES
jgi:16S rRNA processing protein RimM